MEAPNYMQIDMRMFLCLFWEGIYGFHQTLSKIPGLRKIPHVVEQLSLGTTTTEPMSHNY